MSHQATRDSLRVEEHRSLSSRTAEWDALVAQMPLPSPFLRSWWLESVSDASAVFALVLDDAGRLVGGLPVARTSHGGVRVLRFLGSGPLCPDHLDVVTDPAATDAVLAELDAWVRAQSPVVVDLDGLAEDAALSRAWGPALPRDLAPYRLVPEPSAYENALSASTRKAHKRAGKALRGRGIHHELVGPAELEAALTAFRTLQERREGRGGLVSVLPPLFDALRAGHPTGEVRLDVLTDGTVMHAVMVCFVVEGRIGMYQVARSLAPEAAGAGNVLMDTVFRDAAHRSAVREIDMLRGGETYKFKFVDRTRTLGRVRRGHGARGRLLAAAWRVGATGKRSATALRQRFAERSGRSRRLAAP